jgi:hypothetical protein
MIEPKSPVFEEKEDHAIVRLKYPRLEIKALDTDCTPKQLEYAVRALYGMIETWERG